MTRDCVNFTGHYHLSIMAALKQISRFSGTLNALSTKRGYRLQDAKTFYTYVNEPAMPIPGKEPCWVKTSEEAAERAGLASGKPIEFFKHIDLPFFSVL